MLFSNLILVCMSLGFMSTAFSTVLAPVAADLQITLSQAQWLTSGYVLALAALTPLSAYLTSRFPTRRLYIAAVGSYALMSAACAMSGHFGMLLTFRIAQACANALIANVTQVSIMTLFEPSRRGRAMGWFGMTQGAAVLIVAQRVTTVLGADRIVVLDEGKVAGIGTHKELMETCQVYKEIVLSQLSAEEVA